MLARMLKSNLREIVKEKRVNTSFLLLPVPGSDVGDTNPLRLKFNPMRHFSGNHKRADIRILDVFGFWICSDLRYSDCRI